jgi:hypothetical protein
MISAFYYFPNLVAGDLLTERTEDFWHKTFKYIAILVICGGFFVLYRNVLYAFQVQFLFLTALVLAGAHPTGLRSNFGFDVIIVLLVLIGILHYASRLNEMQLRKILRTVIISSVLVSVVSYFEYFVFEPVLGEFWRNTGGFRSVSTLLNPNNCGIYLGCSFVFLYFSDVFEGKLRLFFEAVILGALLLTGSRTAWVALISAIAIGAVYRGHGRVNFILICKSIFYGLFFGILFAFLMAFEVIELPSRMLDFETALIRMEKYFHFVSDFDATYFWPDSGLLRIDVVSESGYFHFINAVGIIAASPVFLYIFLRINPSWVLAAFAGHRGRCFDVAVVYYMIAMLFENVFMSFPNNQLLFISIGASIGCYNARKKFS